MKKIHVRKKKHEPMLGNPKKKLREKQKRPPPLPSFSEGERPQILTGRRLKAQYQQQPAPGSR